MTRKQLSLQKFFSRLSYLFGLCLLLVASAVSRADLPINTKIGGDFSLPSTASAGTTSLAEYEGRPVLLNFGFTHCPDICPMVLQRLSHALNQLGSGADQVQVLFVSFDPERDTVSHLRDYLKQFDERIIGLTGTKEQALALLSQYGAVAMSNSNTEGHTKAPLYSHTDHIYLIDQEGRVRALYGRDVPVSDIVAGVNTLLSKSNWWSKLFGQ